MRSKEHLSIRIRINDLFHHCLVVTTLKSGRNLNCFSAEFAMMIRFHQREESFLTIHFNYCSTFKWELVWWMMINIPGIGSSCVFFLSFEQMVVVVMMRKRRRMMKSAKWVWGVELTMWSGGEIEEEEQTESTKVVISARCGQVWIVFEIHLLFGLILNCRRRWRKVA